MKLTTTFWSETVFEFDKILFINGNTNDIIFQADLNDAFASYIFFKNISKFVMTPLSRKALLKQQNSDYYDLNEKVDCFQFAVIKDGEIMPIKWFDLYINQYVKISHDIAFETTLVKKNGLRLSFGKFPMCYYNINLPQYRALKIQAKAYKYFANQIKKNIL